MNFSILLPELTALAVLVVLMVKEIFNPRSAWNALTGGALLTLAALFFLYGKNGAFNGILVLDPLALFFKTLFLGIVFVLIFISREFFKDRTESASEFLLILWTSLLGLFFLASANDFLLMFIALETFTLSLYVLAAYLKRDLVSIESGLKYLVLGSVASAFVIYGISLLFVAAGSTSFLMVRDIFSAHPGSRLILLGVLFILAGLGFKIASVPFQLWVPDVYEGAPTPVVAYLSTASKSAGFVLLLRLLFTAFPAFNSQRHLLFAALAAMTLIYGNLGALVQTNIKRLFGYSSISHAGYLLIGLAAGQSLAVSAILYYLMAYIFSNLAAFIVITLTSKATGSDQISSYAGLGKRSPFLAGLLFLSLLSLAGVPPLAGFFGKFMILLAAVRSGLGWLALLGALLVAVSLYYYLSLVRVMYFDPAAAETPIAVPASLKIILLVLAGLLVIAGLFQAPFFTLAQRAAGSLF